MSVDSELPTGNEYDVQAFAARQLTPEQQKALEQSALPTAANAVKQPNATVETLLDKVVDLVTNALHNTKGPKEAA